ncbi:AAA family ATPase [Cryptosporangium sp. NPDC051539]|uniref:AAA family ATPase n=1 Tax=Cryptosporangium sp. NPDC051539 TaxID=3363962 RepID=UPI00379F6B02
MLLHGPPGTGKTHTVRFLLGALPGLTVVLLAGPSIQYVSEAAQMAWAPLPALVVLEDCDLVAEDRDHYPGSQPLLFAVLEALDGLSDDAGVAFLLTTNRVDVLEPALAQRPGRVDLAIEVRAIALAVFRAPREIPFHDPRGLIADTYAGLGWHVPEMLAGLDGAPEIYFDSIARVSVPSWTSGRTALPGDAAWGVTLGGMGVGTGIVGAYVLAGELAAAGGDLGAALTAYERRMRPYAGRWQKNAQPGRFLAPRTRHGLWLRNTMLSNALVRRSMLGGTRKLADEPALPAYAGRRRSH